jgi:hypothetical protein
VDGPAVRLWPEHLSQKVAAIRDAARRAAEEGQTIALAPEAAAPQAAESMPSLESEVVDTTSACVATAFVVTGPPSRSVPGRVSSVDAALTIAGVGGAAARSAAGFRHRAARRRRPITGACANGNEGGHAPRPPEQVSSLS